MMAPVHSLPTEANSVIPWWDKTVPCPTTVYKSRSGVVRLLFVGRDFYREGGDLLLRWTQQTRTLVPWELHLVTDDVFEVLPPGVFAHTFVQPSGHPGMPMRSPELSRLYQVCDLLVLPTGADIDSPVVIEAMALGLPVLAASGDRMPAIIADEQLALLFAPEDFAQMTSRLEYLIESPTVRQKMGHAARERALGFLMSAVRQF